MKKLFLFLLLLIPILGFNQSACLKYIEKGKFSKAEKKIEKSLSKKPGDIELIYYKSRLYMEPKFKKYDTKESYRLLLDSRRSFHKISDEKELKQYNKIPLNNDIYSNYIDTVCLRALDDAILLNTESGYQDYLNFYSLMPNKCISIATKNRNSVAYESASAVNTPEAYQLFINKYPNAEQYYLAKEKRNALEYLSVQKSDKIEDYKSFINKYPDANEVKMAWERIHELAFEEAERINTSMSFYSFIEKYPTAKQYSNAYKLYEELKYRETTVSSDWDSYEFFIENNPKSSWVSVALDSMWVIASNEKQIGQLRFCVDHFEGGDRKKALLLLHDVFTDDGETTTLDLFYSLYNDGIFYEIKKKDYELASMADELELENGYDSSNHNKYDEYIRLAAPNERAFLTLQVLIAPDLKRKYYQNALATVKKYKDFFGEDYKKVNNLIEILEADYDYKVKVNSVGYNVNTNDGGEYVPIISGDDKHLYFCGKDRSDNVGGEDIFVSKKKNGYWTKAKIITELSSYFENDAPLSVSVDGTTMLLFKSGYIYTSEKTKYGWSHTKKLPNTINANEWQADAMISSDGKALIFAAKSDENFNLNMNTSSSYHGGYRHQTDIYVSLLDQSGNWGKPLNLGSTINTIYTDRSPFLHPDMKTLYFCSDGHGGLGDLDFFKSTRLSDTCWDCWSEPINMGKEINTEERDWAYQISTNGEVAYFSREDSKNNNNIYYLNIPTHLRPDYVATVSGNLVDRNNQPVSAEIRWEDLETGKNIGQSKSDPVDGSFFIVLPLGKIYGYYVDTDDYFPISNNIDLRDSTKAVVIDENIDLISFKQMIDEGTAVPVNNLFFSVAKTSLLPSSIPELKRVAEIIKTNGLKVEISGHTDSDGEEEDNQILSEKRANAVKEFLINEGCNADSIITIGFGESKPVAPNDTEKGKAKNRRVELKFVE